MKNLSCILLRAEDYPKFIEVLVLQFGMEVDVRSRLKYTPLHEAVRTWSFESVKKLVELGADIYAFSGKVKDLGYDRWMTPLDLAKKSRSVEIKEFLMQVHQRHKQEGLAKALSYETTMQVFDSVTKDVKRAPSFINSCRKLLRKLTSSK